MNKFFSDHIALFVIMAMLLAVIALIVASRRNRRIYTRPTTNKPQVSSNNENPESSKGSEDSDENKG